MSTPTFGGRAYALYRIDEPSSKSDVYAPSSRNQVFASTMMQFAGSKRFKEKKLQNLLMGRAGEHTDHIKKCLGQIE